MKAEDTVMLPEDMVKFIPPIAELYDVHGLCLLQAEITFEACKKYFCGCPLHLDCYPSCYWWGLEDKKCKYTMKLVKE